MHWHWLAHLMGIDNETGPIYAFWSGFGSDITEFALLGGVATLYRRHTCHVNSPRFCWRPGVHPVEGTPFKACRRHHPTVPNRISARHIADAHQVAQADRTDGGTS